MRTLSGMIEFLIILGILVGFVQLSYVRSSSKKSPVQALHRTAHVFSNQRNRISQEPTRGASFASASNNQAGTVSVSQLSLEATSNPASSPGVNSTGNAANSTNPPSFSTPSTTTSTHDPNSDLDEPPLPPTLQENSTTSKAPNKDDPGGSSKNSNKAGNATGDNQSGPSERVNIELGVLWYSVFMVYVSFVKLFYHNVSVVKRNLTEPGILMIFGIIWELISRQVNTSLDVSPRFNSRIFFYLFLPSTVLESASILSNKWLLLNLLPILIHSIVGTLLYGSAIAFTIHSMSKQDLFNIGTAQPTQTATIFGPSEAGSQWLPFSSANDSTRIDSPSKLARMMTMSDDPEESSFLYEKSYVINAPMLEVGNLTIADCLIFGSIMSSLDSNTMLGAFSVFQVNEKLYYLVLGESLMNNAVVLIVFNLLLDFLNTSRLTVLKIYIAIIQFFITLIGSIFVGLLLASVALLAVRLMKRFHVPSALTSYQNQCLAMIETLLVLKLAYLTYTLGSLAGLSSIVSLATFGLLQDQYIRLNLNLRSQLTFRQVVLATKTMGFSLVYPLLGMLLVDVAYASQYQMVNQSPSSSMSMTGDTRHASQASFFREAATKLTSMASQVSLIWNFKFLSLVTVISIVYRFGIVILLSMFCNLVSSRKVKVKFREQLLMAYGGLKGPLAVALVHRLIEHQDHRDRMLRNKHLFMYTILCITLLSVIFKGAFIRPLVERIQNYLDQPKPVANQKFVLFNAINTKVIERTTHVINSLIGRSKSPYDRLFEFNESRIKPWLARDGSDTYWLSNLYDKLLLDETLDSNCFYRSTENSLAGSFWRSRRRLNDPTEDTVKHRASITNPKLDTINEHGDEFIDDDLDASNSHLGLSIRQATSKAKTKNGSRKSSRDLAIAGGSRRGTGLKEFVMLDLNSIENNLGRKRPARSVRKMEPTNSSVPILPDNQLMSSFDGSADETGLPPQSSSDKEGYISQLERHLDARRRTVRPSISKFGINGNTYDVDRSLGNSTKGLKNDNSTRETIKKGQETNKSRKTGRNRRHKGKSSRVEPRLATSSSD